MRVAVRHPERASLLERRGRAGQITAVYADVWEEASVGAAVDGSEAVINMVGHYLERSKATFEATRGHGAMHVARASARAGVQRLVHISGLGTDAQSDSPYARARGIGERLVTEAFPAATILRPGVIFGPEGGFLNRLAALARVLPVMPLFGAGETKLQPVFVGDVAEAVAEGFGHARDHGQALRARRSPGLHLQGAHATGARTERTQAIADAGSILRLESTGGFDGAFAGSTHIPEPGRTDATRQRGARRRIDFG